MTASSHSTRARHRPELDALIHLFYEQDAELGRFREVNGEGLPQPYEDLLNHEAHMTVTVEAFHGGAVTVEVLETRRTETHYSRKILLRREDGRVVQFGLVRLSRSALADQVRDAIESERVPLGRILIEHHVMRDVRLMSLWEVAPGPDMMRAMELPTPEICYGRTALIYCDDLPAVELLEVLPPVEFTPRT